MEASNSRAKERREFVRNSITILQSTMKFLQAPHSR